MMFRFVIGVVMAIVGFIITVLGRYKRYEDELPLIITLFMVIIGITLVMVGVVITRLAWITILANTMSDILPTVVGIIH